jgi:Bacterial Alpha-2-macroglobulin MG10 domain/MG2 domain/Alpha-2-macroglobulin family
MKKIIILFIAINIHFVAMAQTPKTEYDILWEKVEKQTAKNASKDALKIIETIIAKARKENNSAEKIKAICLQLGIAKQSTENENSKAIETIEKELATAKNIEAQIWHSLLADIYLQHYQQNRWQLLQRTKLDKPSTDIKEWNAQQYFDAITMHYTASIADKEALKKIPTTAYRSIVKEGTNTDNIYKTMYEVLADKALQFYEKDEIELTKPAYAFIINAQDGFADAEQFMNNKIKSSDENSCKYKALQLYQELMQYYSKTSNSNGLIDMDIKRIAYVLSHTNDSKKDKLELDALENIYKKYPTNKYGILAKLSIAEKIKDDVSEHNYFSYDDQDDENEVLQPKPNRRLEAKAICEMILKTAKDSTNIKMAKNILSEITRQEIKLINEPTYIPNENILANICYRNCSKVYCYVLPKKYYANLENELEDNESILAKCKNIIPTEYNLPNSQDALNHSTDIKINGLSTGFYNIIITNSKNLKDKKLLSIINTIQVSNIAYFVIKQQYTENDKIIVVHRKTGAPISNASLKFYHTEYNNSTNKSTYKLTDDLPTNKDGMRAVNYSYNAEKIEITAGNDKYISDGNNYFSQKPNLDYKPNYNLVIFTDRNIYRPNQTIYFKGIYLKQNDSSTNYETEIVKNINLEINFNDANGQKISSQVLITNEFGSIADSFKIPEGLLGGSYSITHTNGSVNVQVEEYKRPKFEVVVDTITKGYQVNESIQISGFAKAYAGNGLQDAQVTYSVTRRTRLIYDWCRWGNWNSSNTEMQIANGVIKTDADGKYNFTFMAIPDDEMDRKTFPIFDYEISIDVADINGETHNKKTIISVGYQAIQLSTEVPEKSKAIDCKEIKVFTKNMNNAFVASDVKINCYALQNNGGNKKTKLWRTPDQFIMSKGEFKNNFANEEYAFENDYTTWAKGKLLFTKNNKTSENGIITLDKIPDEDMYIVLEISTIDNSGDTLIDKKYIRIIKSANAKPIAEENILISKTEKNNELKVALAQDAKYILQVQSSPRNMPIIEWKTDNDYNAIQQFSITKKDYHQKIIGFGYYSNNRFYDEVEKLKIEKEAKDITINITTFRDKLTPGSNEKWTVNITGKDKDAVHAELMTSMYDASLDDLLEGDWQGINSINHINNFYNSNKIFETKEDQMIENSDNELIEEPNVYLDNNLRLDELMNYYISSGAIINIQDNNVRTQKVMLTKGVTASASMVMTEKSFEANNSEVIIQKQNMITKNEESDEVNKPKPTPPPSIRKNFQETAFWFPQLHTDKNGDITFTFTTPDALTKWRWRMLAHTQNLQSATAEKYITTQKELMVVTNNTRFYRAGDQAIYTGKVVNTSNKTLIGNLQLDILNASTEKSINSDYKNTKNSLPFSIQAGESVSINFPISIPENDAEPILLKLIATAKSSDGNTYSDGEQNAIPVLLNSMLVTESQAFAVRGGQTKQVNLPNLIITNETQKHYNYTIETTSNPTWYAVQSLPYLAEFPYECAEQTFSRFFAHRIGNHIMNSNPLIAKVLDAWRITDTNALLSNLEKNQELKSVLLQETPWLMQAKNETEQKHQLALLLDLKTSAIKSKQAYDKLAQMQTAEGGFTWFPGMRPDAFITQYILTGFGKLLHLQIINAQTMETNYPIVASALAYTDREIVKRHKEILKQKAKAKSKKMTAYYSADEMQYLYMRSFYSQQNINDDTKKAIDFYIAEASRNVFTQSILMQAMSAITLHRYGKQQLAKDIVKGLQQNAITTDADGMYWKANTSGYYWHQAPIETQSVLIECFEEITHDTKSIDEMKIWLLKNKQTHNWATTKATADAVYAMLLRGSNFLATTADLQIKVGDKQLNMKDYPAEAGTGYTKIHFAKNTIKPQMGNIQVSNANAKSPLAWGAVYYQYFQNLDKIKTANNDIAIQKKLMIVTNSVTGEVLKEIPKTGLAVGEKVRVRIVLTVNKSMDYVHLKDMRGACFEPINVISAYKYNNGLGYYESTKDVATHFFFDHINKGTYVFEYDLFASNKGTYSNGIANIECMYAPEFSGHSEGVLVTVK